MASLPKKQSAMNASRAAGVTIVELMITIAVLAILLTVAVPNFRSVINNNRVSGAANSLVTAMAYARSEAVARSAIVRLCPANAAFTDCSGDDDWGGGLVIRLQEGPGEGEILRVWEPLSSAIALGQDLDDTASDNHVDFLPLGNVAVGGTDFTFVLELQPVDCPAGRPFRREVILGRSGRAQVVQPTGGCE